MDASSELLEACSQSIHISELYQRVLPFLSCKLASESNIEKILSFTYLLPQNLEVKHFGFECPMGEKKTYVDMGFSIDFSLFDKMAVYKWFHFDSFSPFLKEDGSWTELLLLFEKSQNENFFIKKGIYNIWFECDVGSSLQWPPSPNLLFNFSLENIWENIEETISFFGNKKILGQLKTTIEILKKHNIYVTTLGFMIGRGSDWVKLCFSVDQNLHCLKKFFFDLECFSNIDPLLKFLFKVKTVAKNIHLQVDINTAISLKIGIECTPKSSHDLKELTLFLDFFLAESLISLDEYEALLSWRGGTVELIKNSRFKFIRYVNHIKVNYYPGTEHFKSKVYVGAFCEPELQGMSEQ